MKSTNWQDVERYSRVAIQYVEDCESGHILAIDGEARLLYGRALLRRKDSANGAMFIRSGFGSLRDCLEASSYAAEKDECRSGVNEAASLVPL